MSRWATEHIEKLKKGEIVKFRPLGNSMKGKIASGELVTVKPATDYAAGDIVLCTVRTDDYLHLIHKIIGDRFLIGNNIGGFNGWIKIDKIYGKLI
jgi:hypothetical protein